MEDQLPGAGNDDSAASGSSQSGGFWKRWDSATRDSGSVKRNLAVLFGVTLAAMLCIGAVGGAVALVLGSVHAWPVAGTGVGLASVLTALGIRLRRGHPKP